MPRGMYRSRTFRRVKKRLPTGTKTRYLKRKPKRASCSTCKKPLQGVPNERPYKMQNMPKTKKRPERPYGGVLCSSCSRRKIIEDIKTRYKND